MRRLPLRPSSLPGLFECDWMSRSYDDQPSVALKRGSWMDELYRESVIARINGKPEPEPNPELGQRDVESVRWGVEKTFKLAQGQAIHTDKEECKVVIPGFPNTGEVDALIPYWCSSIDAKSGKVYDYTRQQAAYAYGLMLKQFADEWTIFMLYFDERAVAPYRFTFKAAEEIVQYHVDKYARPEEPRANNMCGFCSNFDICPTQRSLAETAYGHLKTGFDFEAIKSDPAKLSEFMYACSALEEYHKRGRQALRGMLERKIEVPFYRNQKMIGAQKVRVKDLVNQFGGEKVGQVIADVELETYEKMLKKFGGELNENIIYRAPDIHFPSQTIRGKKKKEKLLTDNSICEKSGE